MSGRLPQTPPGSQLPPELTQPDPGQGSGPAGGFFTSLWPEPAGPDVSEALFSVACPPQVLGPVLGPLACLCQPLGPHHPSGLAPLTVVPLRGAWG